MQLNASHYVGNYTSKIFDAGAISTWNNITWTQGGYYQQELPNSQATETGLGGANMTGNVLLMHFNNNSAIGENDTLVYDWSGSLNNGTVIGATWTSDGKLGAGAFEFDGSGDGILTSINLFNTSTFNNSGMTVSFWVKVANIQKYSGSKILDIEGGYFFKYTNSSGTIIFSIDGTDSTALTTTLVNDSHWHHIVGVAVADGSTGDLTIYVDGKIEATDNDENWYNINNLNNPVSIGRHPSNFNENFNGSIDEVAIWNRSLSAVEVSDIYKRGVLELNLSVRSCNDAACSGESWSDIGNNTSPQDLSVTANQYFQYNFEFDSNSTTYSPLLYNVTIDSNNSIPTITLNSPSDTTSTQNTTIIFNCSAIDNLDLANITLYGNWSGGWHANATNYVNGTSNESTFTKNLTDGIYIWNCLAYDNDSNSDWGNSNYTLTIDSSGPVIDISSPLNNSLENSSSIITFTYNATDIYSSISNCSLIINGAVNKTSTSITETINQTFTYVMHNGSYNWSVNCTDDLGNVGSSTKYNLSVSTADVIASTCNFTDVNASITSANSGDTLVIPVGNCAWNKTLVVSKPINLIGAGSDTGGTNLTYSSGANPLFYVTNSNVRISAIMFNMGIGDYKAIDIYGTLTNIRIDHCSFAKGQNTIYTSGFIQGVIDDNIFTNCGTSGSRGSLHISGDNNAAWIRAYNAGGIYAGTKNALFLENNRFIVNNDYQNAVQDAQVYIQEGASVVVRQNTFDFSACTNATWTGAILNNHGNWVYYTGNNYATASPIFEFYNNTWNASGLSGLSDIIGIRGGSSLIHDNIYELIGGANSPRSIINFVEEEAWQTSFFDPLRTEWPAQDQVINTFIWNETYTGNAPQYGTVENESITDVYILGSNSGIFIRKDYEYFMHNPELSGGYSYYTGTRYGGSQSYPTDGTLYALDNGNTAWSSTGPNAYYPYVPYYYPHPLVSGIPGVDLDYPSYGDSISGSIEFNYSAIDSSNLQNVSLYGNWSGGWHLNETANITGTYNSSNLTLVLDDGRYHWSFYVCDDENNCRFGTRNYTLTTDATAPVGTLACSPTTVTVGGTVTCTCAVTDAIVGVNTSQTSYTASPSTSIAGTQSTTCTFEDILGNSGTTSLSYTVNAASTGGGTVSVAPSLTHSWSVIVPETPTIMEGFDEEIGIKEIEIEVNSEASDVQVSVTQHETNPVSAESVGSVYKYLQIATENLEDKLEKGIVVIRVEKNWTLENGIDRNNVAMFEFNESLSEWMELVTIFTEEDEKNYYYEVELTSFSYFMIGEKVLIEEEIEEERFDFIGMVRNVWSFVKVNWLWFSIGGGVIILVVVGIVLLKKGKGKEKREEKKRGIGKYGK